MSRKTQGRIRALLAIPSAAVLVFGATQALASPAPSPPPDDCRAYCEGHWAYCAANPSTFSCRFCGCNVE